MPTPPLLHSEASGIHPASYLLPAGPVAPKTGHCRVDTSTTPWQLQVYDASGGGGWHNVGLVSPVPPSGGGAMTLLDSGRLAADAASITTAALPATASNLRLVARLRGTQAATSVQLYVRCNGDSAAHYMREYIAGQSNAASALGQETVAQSALGSVPAANSIANAWGRVDLLCIDYTSSTTRKEWAGSVASYFAANSETLYQVFGGTSQLAALSTFTLLPDLGSWLAGSAWWVYGLA